MSKTTPEEAKALADKHSAKISEYSQSLLLITTTQLAALIDEVRGVGAEPVAWPDYEHENAVMQGEQNDATESWNRGVTFPSNRERRYFENGFESGWSRAKNWIQLNVFAHPVPSQPAAPVELPVVAWLEHHKAGDNLSWEQVDHPYAKADALVKLSDAQAAIAAGRKVS